MNIWRTETPSADWDERVALGGIVSGEYWENIGGLVSGSPALSLSGSFETFGLPHLVISLHAQNPLCISFFSNNSSVLCRQ